MPPSPGFDHQSDASLRNEGMSDGSERERILAAARSLLRTKPLSAFTRPEIARLADLQPDVVSRHFRNKRQLLSELKARPALDA